MLFDHFEKESAASRELCEKYESQLPSEVLTVWRSYGFGTLLDGYLKVVNPEDYSDLLADTYQWSDSAIPIFVTAFADIITWERGRYIRMVNYKAGTFEGIAAGFKFFWGDVLAGEFDGRFFDIEQYKAAINKCGRLQFDECYGYVPLLALGGSKKIENLHKVKIKEHIEFISQTVGKIGL